MGGAMFQYDSRVIAIDPEWPFKDNELLLTMEHEYGHALGLPHRYGNSIMKPGWDPPFASAPTEEDFSDLRRISGAKAHLPEQRRELRERDHEGTDTQCLICRGARWVCEDQLDKP